MSETTSVAERMSDRRLLIAGAALTGVGTALGCVGVTLLTIAAGRGWARHLDVPPGQLATLKWHQLREASRAGAEAWRKTAPNGAR